MPPRTLGARSSRWGTLEGEAMTRERQGGAGVEEVQEDTLAREAREDLSEEARPALSPE